MSSTPGNLPVTVFLSGQSDHRQKTLTAGKIFRRPIFPTPTIPEGAPGGDLQSPPTFVKAPASKEDPRAGHSPFSGRRLHLTRRRVRPFPATRLLLQPRLQPTSIPTYLVLPFEPCTYLFWGFLSPSALQTVFPAKLRLFFSPPQSLHVPWEVFFYLSGGTTPRSEAVSLFSVVPRRNLKPY